MDYGVFMSPIDKQIAWTSVSLALLAGVAQADVPDLKDPPYKVILTRNAFGLKPPPPPPPVDTTEVGPPPNVKLTGIIAITSPKKAMLVVTPVGKPTPIYLTVNEGDFSDDSLLKVVEIDEQAGSVRIVMNGATSTLDFEKNGIKNATAPAPPPGPAGLPAIPGMAPQPGTPQPIPGAGGSAPTQLRTLPSGPGQPAAPANSLQTIPTRQLRSQPQSQLGPAVPEKPLSVEQSVILKKVDEMVNQDKINKKQYPPALPIPELDQ